jgi:hypothetical protein
LPNLAPLMMSPSEFSQFQAFARASRLKVIYSVVRFCLETGLSPSVKAGGYGVAGTNYSLSLRFDHHR